jgi:hypothetical protein
MVCPTTFPEESQRVLIQICVTFIDGSDSFHFNFDENLQLLCGSPAAAIEHVPEAHLQESININNVFSLISTNGLSDSFELDAILDVPQFPLLLNLPYFQLKDSILQSSKWRSPAC